MKILPETIKLMKSIFITRICYIATANDIFFYIQEEIQATYFVLLIRFDVVIFLVISVEGKGDSSRFPRSAFVFA